MQSEMADESVFSREGLGADVAREGPGSGVAQLMAIAMFTAVERLAAMFARQGQRRQHLDPGMRRDGDEEKRRGPRTGQKTIWYLCYWTVPAGPTLPSGGRGMEIPLAMAPNTALRLLVSVYAV